MAPESLLRRRSPHGTRKIPSCHEFDLNSFFYGKDNDGKGNCGNIAASYCDPTPHLNRCCPPAFCKGCIRQNTSFI
ncbi:MAG: hypothetical protein DYH02_09945 [Candidatus Omnitrophica bacterium COP1]|nr:hypothetical protein [Candidatus Omnitrophica bacterium COP1]